MLEAVFKLVKTRHVYACKNCIRSSANKNNHLDFVGHFQPENEQIMSEALSSYEEGQTFYGAVSVCLCRVMYCFHKQKLIKRIL